MQSLLKLKRLRTFLFFLHLKICMCSSSCLNIVYCKVTKVAGLTGPQRAAAPPGRGGCGLPARLPQGQVVLVIRGDPRRTQHGPDIQAEREENTHQTHQLQGRQRRHAHFLRSAHGWGHVGWMRRRWGAMLRWVAEKPGTIIPDNFLGSAFSVLKIVEQLRERDAVTAALALLWTRLHCTLLKNHCCTYRVLVPRTAPCLVWTILLQKVRADIESTIHWHIELRTVTFLVVKRKYVD